MTARLNGKPEDMFYIGTPRRWRKDAENEARVIAEIAHPGYGWLSVVEAMNRQFGGDYFICFREDRRQTTVQQIMLIDPLHPYNEGVRHVYQAYSETVQYEAEEEAVAALPAFRYLLTLTPKYKSRKKRDIVRRPMYVWEDGSVPGSNGRDRSYFRQRPELTEQDATREIAQMLAQYAPHIGVPQVTMKELPGDSLGTCGFRKINLDITPAKGAYGTSRLTITHELAHHIVNSTKVLFPMAHDSHNVRAHGPEFMGVLIDLYVTVHGCDRTVLEQTARGAGLALNYDFRPGQDLIDRAAAARAVNAARAYEVRA